MGSRGEAAPTDWFSELGLRLGQQLDDVWHQVSPCADSSALRAALDDAVKGGKRLRPRLLAEVHNALGGKRPLAVLGAAAAVELLHTAFLVHDDLIDGDDLRRGAPSVPGRFRAQAEQTGASTDGAAAYAVAGAVLAGDLALVGAMRAFATLDISPVVNSRSLELVSHALTTSAAGELADVRYTLGGPFPSPEEVLELAARKTAAYSFTLPMQLGAVLAGADDRVVDLVGEAGRCLGIAFQLQDDLAGMFADTEASGKDAGGDLREGKITLLVCHARTTSAWATLEPALGNPLVGPERLRDVRRALEESGTRSYVETVAAEHLRSGAACAREAGIDLEAKDRLMTLLTGQPSGVAA
jgi:geranylgeranyl diphosphate synthase type II